MDTPERYRIEDGRACIDIRVRESRQLFDGRDPAPFHERDLDEAAVAYLLGAAQEIPRAQALKIVINITEEAEPHLAPEVIAEAVRQHFAHERQQVSRRLGEQLRRGRTFLAIGLAVLTVFLSASELALGLPAGPAREILREGLVITGWVAMWRPLEVLLYDWWPLMDERRQLERVLGAQLVVSFDASS